MSSQKDIKHGCKRAKTALSSRQNRMDSTVQRTKCTAHWLYDAHCCAHYGPAVPVERPGYDSKVWDTWACFTQQYCA
jgi:hypothetical protein